MATFSRHAAGISDATNNSNYFYDRFAKNFWVILEWLMRSCAVVSDAPPPFSRSISPPHAADKNHFSQKYERCFENIQKCDSLSPRGPDTSMLVSKIQLFSEHGHRFDLIIKISLPPEARVNLTDHPHSTVHARRGAAPTGAVSPHSPLTSWRDANVQKPMAMFGWRSCSKRAPLLVHTAIQAVASARLSFKVKASILAIFGKRPALPSHLFE
jgi:hypothetical protein